MMTAGTAVKVLVIGINQHLLPDFFSQGKLRTRPVSELKTFIKYMSKISYLSLRLDGITNVLIK